MARDESGQQNGLVARHSAMWYDIQTCVVETHNKPNREDDWT